eukprot:scaffold376792_cov28-Prasinocladus_malaysianus.AAC.1
MPMERFLKVLAAGREPGCVPEQSPHRAYDDHNKHKPRYGTSCVPTRLLVFGPPNIVVASQA